MVRLFQHEADGHGDNDGRRYGHPTAVMGMSLLGFLGETVRMALKREQKRNKEQRSTHTASNAIQMQ